MIDILIDLDTQLMLWLNGFNTEIIDPIVKQFSGRWIWLPLYVSIAAMIIKLYGWRKGLIMIVAIGAAVGCADMICARAIRPFCERLRPANLENPISEFIHIVDGYRGGRYGFPSCHAANSFALAISSCLILRYRPYTLFILSWAILQCYSRIYIGVHYPGDILVGAIIGSAMGVAAYYGSKKWNKGDKMKIATFSPILYVGLATLVAIVIIALI